MNNAGISTPIEIVTKEGDTLIWCKKIEYTEYTIRGISVKDEKEYLKYLMPYVDLVSFCFTYRTDFYGLDDDWDIVKGYEAFCSYYSERDWTWFVMRCNTKTGRYSLFDMSFDVKPNCVIAKAYCGCREGLIEFETALQASVCAFIASTGDTKQLFFSNFDDRIVRGGTADDGAFMDAYLRYSGKAIIDCTNFAAMSPEDPLGYMCGGDVALFSDGTLQIRPDSPEDNEVEQFSVRSIVHADNNINNYDPEYRNTVSIMTKEKCFQFTFLTTDDKKKFWDALTDA